MKESCLFVKRQLISQITGDNKNVFLNNTGHFLLAAIGDANVNDSVYEGVIDFISKAQSRDLFSGDVSIRMIRSVHCLVKGAYERGIFKGISSRVTVIGCDFFKMLVLKYVNALGLKNCDDGDIVISEKLIKYENGDKKKIYLCCVLPGEVCDDERFFLNFDNQYSIGMTCKWTDFLPKCIRHFVRIPVAFDEVVNYVKCEEYSITCVDKACECSKQVVEHDLEYMVVSAIMGVSYPKMVESYDIDHGGEDICEACESVSAVETVPNLYCVARWCFGTCNVQKLHPLLDRSLHKHMVCLNYDAKFSSDSELYNFIIGIYEIGEDFSVSDHFIDRVKSLYEQGKVIYKDQRIPWAKMSEASVPVRELKKGRGVKAKKKNK